MNYKISVYADRVKGKSGYTIESQGSVVANKIMRFEGNNIKENALRSIYLAIKACKVLLSHNDILIVEVQNVHMCNWLNGLVEYKEYSLWLDKIFEELELIDCRYRFYFNSKPFAKSYIKDREVTGIELGTVDDMMKDFD